MAPTSALVAVSAGMTVSLLEPLVSIHDNSRVWRAAQDRERTSRTGTAFSSRRLGSDLSPLEDNAVLVGKVRSRRRSWVETACRKPVVV